MKIKEINLYGFKSFPADTRIILNSGVTAFVGPNGSGKSNIFDALRWVFGEQSMKALRCERIEDLIYVSPDLKEDASFTEVAVIIDNEDYFTQFGSEFEIKRRFYKTGESEFFLNRVKCRLQDIQALFLNSGTLTYSFLELSEIEKIIHGDTKEMFDDVSGILKYRERREQTRRRLEVTEQDLLRLEDIIAEMQRGLRTLRRQVRQTKLYQELRDEYNGLSLFIARSEFNKTTQEFARLEHETNNQETQRQSLLQEIRSLEKEREVLKNEMEQVEVMKKETVHQISLLDDKIGALQKQLESKEAEIKQLDLVRERTLTSIQEKAEILNNNKKRLLDLENTKSEVQSNIGEANYKIANGRKELDFKNEGYFALKEKINAKDGAYASLFAEIQSAESQVAKTKLEIDNKETILKRIVEEYDLNKLESDSQKRLTKELEQGLETIIGEQDEAGVQLQKQSEKLANLEEKLKEIESDLQKRQEALTEYKIGIDTLMHRLKEKGDNKEIRDIFDKKIKNIFRNSIQVSAGYESIIDLCLGDLLNFYLVTDYAKEDFTRLPEGRFGFLNTKTKFPQSAPPEALQSLAPITKFVKFKADQDALQNHMNSYFLIEDFHKANELSQQFLEYGFVTPDGILFKNGAVIAEHGEIGFFKINQTLKQYKEQLETLQNEFLFMQEERKRLINDIEDSKSVIEKEKNGLFAINVKKSELSMKLNELGKRIEKVHKDGDALKREQEKLQNECTALKGQNTKLAQTIAQTRAAMEKIGAEKNLLLEDSAQLQKDIDSKNSSLNKMTMEIAVLEERRGSLQKTTEDLKNESHAIESEIARLKANAETKDLAEIYETIKALKEESEAKNAEKAGFEAKLPEKLIEEFSVRQTAIYDRLTQSQKGHEEMQNSIMQLRYQSFQLGHKKEELIRRVREEFDVDLIIYHAEEIAEAETKLAEAKGKLEKLGEINPLSLQAYESEKKRLDEYMSQRNDIITAKQNLLKSIEELDNRAKERFVEVFQQVKKEFNFVFANFFEGGEADLMLTDPTNPLSSEVEIVVRMKGKRLKTISQLSGGERTLLAISLLLAFYLVKPAPFCILDEIDAPLDDANVVRFNKFLRNLSQRTQVVIITHNRATMEYADYIYGLTMERPGQSKVISARLADLEKIGIEAEVSTEEH